MIRLESLIAAYGYWALFAGTVLEGEVVLILAGFAAHQGYLRLPWVVLVAFAGSFAGDQAWFHVGRRRGPALLERRAAWRPRVERVRALLARYQTAATLGFRFVYGFRTVTPLALGMGGMSPRRFLALDAVATLLWASAVGTGGYLFGHALETLLGNLRKFEVEAMAAVAGCGVAFWLVRALRRYFGG